MRHHNRFSQRILKHMVGSQILGLSLPPATGSDEKEERNVRKKKKKTDPCNSGYLENMGSETWWRTPVISVL